VTRFLTTDTPDVNTLNTFDLVIISRSIDSGNYELDPETKAWNNGIYKPMMLMGGYAIRSNRLGFTSGTTIPDTGGAVKLTVTNPLHPIFNGIALDGSNTMVNDYTTGLVTLPFQQNGVNTVQRGISVNTDGLAGGGTSLASVGTAGDPAVNGTIIGEWNSGSSMSTSPVDMVGGHRLVFLSGSREHDGAAPNPPSNSQIAGIYDLTPDGQHMFLNAVAYTASSTDYPADFNGDLAVNGLDYQTIRDNFNLTGATHAQGDANFDGFVNFTDFRIWKNTRTGAGSTAGVAGGLSAPVPEPGSLILLLLGMVSVAATSIRRR
jgi:Dockerin type I domain/PEP-CTERM motif